MVMKYLSVSADAKTVKGQKKGYLTGILYLAPHRESGVMNVCAHATPGCIATCLFTAGRGVFPKVRQARINRTIEFKQNHTLFVDQLVKEITSLCKRAAKRKLIPVVRLNGTSDLPWELIKGSNGKSLMNTFPGVQFYDYTKIRARVDRFRYVIREPNYHLTFSRSECNVGDCQHLLLKPTDCNVAVVFETKRGEPLPAEWGGYPVIDGDKHDLRFLDPLGVIVGLRAKGKARKDTSGFVVRGV